MKQGKESIMISTRVAFVISCVLFLLMAIFTHSLLGAILVAALFLAICIYLGWLARKWGKIGRVWGIVEYNKLLFKERYGVLTDVYAAPSEDLLSYFEAWQESAESGARVPYTIALEEEKKPTEEEKEKEKKLTDEEKKLIEDKRKELIEKDKELLKKRLQLHKKGKELTKEDELLIDEGKLLIRFVQVEKATYTVHIMKESGIIFLGLPWVNRIRALPWSVYDEDDEVRHSIFLGDYQLIFGSQHEGVGPDGKEKNRLAAGYDEHGVPDYETGDPIKVASTLTLIVRAWKYVLFGYKLHYPEDVIRDLVLGVWREVLSKHKFFMEEIGGKISGDVSDTDISKLLGAYKPEVLQLAQRYLNEALGIAWWSGKKYENTAKDEPKKLELVTDVGGPIQYYTDPEDYVPGTVGYRVYRDYGAQIRRAICTDLEEVGEPGEDRMTVRETLENLLRIMVSRRVTIVKADADAKQTVITALATRRAWLAEISAFRTHGEPVTTEGDLDKFVATDAEIAAYLERKGLDVLQKLPAQGRAIFYGTPGQKTLTRILGEVAANLEVGKDAVASDKKGEGEKKPGE